MRQFEILRTEPPALFRFNGIVYKEDFDRHYEETFIGLTDAQAEQERMSMADGHTPETVSGDLPDVQDYEWAAHDERLTREWNRYWENSDPNEPVIERWAEFWNPRGGREGWLDYVSRNLDIPRELLGD